MSSLLLTDFGLYVWAGIFGLALFLSVYSIAKYLELKNAPVEEDLVEQDLPPSDFPEPEGEPESGQSSGAAFPLPEDVQEPGGPEQPEEALPARQSVVAGGPAVAFVKGVYEGVSGLDSRLKDIEATLSKHGPGDEFAINFLEDMVSDFDSLDKDKLKARIEYLLADLKK